MEVIIKKGYNRDIQYTQHLVMVGKYAKASCMVYRKDYGLFISDLHVYDEDDYRKGFGSLLVQSVLSVATSEQKVRLDVEKRNNPAIALYKKFGFTKIAERNKLDTMEK